jgi:signal transduction histidine kinase
MGPMVSVRLSESPVSRRARSFLRRWQKAQFQRVVESLPLPLGGPVSLFDNDNVLLASVRNPERGPLLSRTRIELGSPPIAKLVGDVDTLDSTFLQTVSALVLSIDDLATEMDDLSRHALERYRELSLLYDFSEKASSAVALPDLMTLVLRKAVTVVRASGASLVSTLPDGQRFRVVTSVGTVPEVGNEAIRRVVASGRTWVGMSGHTLREVVGDAWLGTLACVPLRTAERTAGVLVVLAGPGRELRTEDQRLLIALASLAAMRIDQVHLMEADSRKRELATLGHVASAIVHDFKNPLTAVRGFAEMIQMPEIRADEHSGLAAQIIDNADRMWGMVDEILHFARGNEASLDLRRTSGEELEQRFTAVLQHTLPQRIALKLSMSGLGPFTADIQKLERVIVNLVRNACEAIIGTGTVSVSGESMDDRTIRITVADDGPGIPPSVRASLFDPFVTSGKTGGTGLGLAIVKKIVEDHKGTVSVVSEPGGGGSRFVVTLPRDPSPRGEQACASES